jgi:peroxiredoxin
MLNLFFHALLAAGVPLTGAPIDGPKGPAVGVGIQSIHPLPVGGSVPDAGLKTLDGQDVRLKDLLKGKPTVLIFYRGGWCPYCNLQMEQLVKLEPKLLALGFQILAISPDKPEKLRESLEKHHLNYTLLSDKGFAVSRAFGLAYQLDLPTAEAMKKHGVDLLAATGTDKGWLPAPAAYVLDAKGTVHFVFTNPDIRVRVDGETLFHEAQKVLSAKP